MLKQPIPDKTVVLTFDDAADDNNEEEIFEALKKAKDGKVVILTIHGVPYLERPWVNTSPKLFLQYLNFLSNHH